MSSVSGAVGAYYAVRSMNAFISGQASLQKMSQDQMQQQMKDLLKGMPQSTAPRVGTKIDIRL